jgi:hypothetical protein
MRRSLLVSFCDLTTVKPDRRSLELPNRSPFPSYFIHVLEWGVGWGACIIRGVEIGMTSWAENLMRAKHGNAKEQVNDFEKDHNCARCHVASSWYCVAWYLG